MKTKYSAGLTMLLASSTLSAQNAGSSNEVPELMKSLLNPIPMFLLIVAILLFAGIVALAGAIKYLSIYKRDKFESKRMFMLALLPLGWFEGAAADQNIIILLVAVILVEIGFILVLVNLIKSILADELKETETASEGFFSINWDKWDRIFNRSVPVTQESEVMTDHEYDGIRELDNSLPPWWKYMFYFTIVFGFAYLLVYHVFRTQPLQSAEYVNEVADAELMKKKKSSGSQNEIDENNVALLTDAAMLTAGKGIYDGNCASCHGTLGQGGVGPNLTDEFWLHGGGMQNIYNTIKNGVTEKGMIAWKSQLSPAAMQKVSSYILSLQNTNPAGAKPPQGEKWVEKTNEVSAQPSDSLLTQAQ